MTYSSHFRYRRPSLHGWSKWLVVLSCPFAALFFDAWLNARMLNRDYARAKLNARFKELTGEVDALRVKEAALQNQLRSELEAAEIGLVKPEPGQVQIVYYESEDPVSVTEPGPYVVARAGATSAAMVGAGISEDGTDSSGGAEADGTWDSESKKSLFEKIALVDRLKNAIDGVSTRSSSGF